MDKPPNVNPKKAKKQSKIKTKQPLKVVYITNPIKFTAATPSEFRALVQELTGQDADVSNLLRFEAAEGVGGDTEELKVAAEDNVHALVDEQVAKIGQTDDLVQNGSGFLTFGSYDEDDAFYCPEMMEWLASRNMRSNQDEENLDVFKRLDDI